MDACFHFHGQTSTCISLLASSWACRVVLAVEKGTEKGEAWSSSSPTSTSLCRSLVSDKCPDATEIIKASLTLLKQKLKAQRSLILVVWTLLRSVLLKWADHPYKNICHPTELKLIFSKKCQRARHKQKNAICSMSSCHSKGAFYRV